MTSRTVNLQHFCNKLRTLDLTSESVHWHKVCAIQPARHITYTHLYATDRQNYDRRNQLIHERLYYPQNAHRAYRIYTTTSSRHTYVTPSHHYNKYHLSIPFYDSYSNNRSILSKLHLTDYQSILVRAIHTDNCKSKDESKIEQTVELLKSSKETELKSSKETDKKASETDKPKTLGQRFIAEVKHYYHGFRLLGVDVKICCKLLWAVLNGKNLTRRERNLLVRTTADLFRLVPFSVFIIVPFMEFLLPVVVALFPGMLPSTFKTANKENEKLKKKLKVKLDMAKFLQDTIEQSAVENKDKSIKDMGQEFAAFLDKVRTSGVATTNEEIMKFSKLFEDEITLDNLSQGQLKALCRVLEIPPIGTNNVLRFQLRLKLRQLKADDKMIQKEGIDSLAVWELQSACRARGMRSLGVPESRLKTQLLQWIDLHLNAQIPTSLLLLSRALFLPELLSAGEQLKATISVLTETTGESAKIKASELAGEKVDNKAKLDLLKKEAEAIEKEKEEERQAEEEEKAAEVKEKLEKEVAAPVDEVDRGPFIIITKPLAHLLDDRAPIVLSKAEEELAEIEREHQISSKDIEEIELAVESIDEEKSFQLELEELKEDVTEYQEEVKELKDVIVQSGGHMQDLQESRAASHLSKKLNSMIDQMHGVISELQKEKASLMEKIEVKEVKIKHGIELQEDKKQELIEKISEEKGDVIGINEMVLALRRIQKVPDETKIQQMLEVLDEDHDGNIEIETVMKVIELLGRENVKLDAIKLSQVLELLNKESLIEDSEKLEKAQKVTEDTEHPNSSDPDELKDAADEKEKIVNKQ